MTQKQQNEEILLFLKNLNTDGWVSLLNKLLVNAPAKIPISMENAVPEEVIAELSAIMNENAIDKTSLENATVSLLFALRGDQTVPYKIATIVNILSILRPPLYNNSVQELILSRSFLKIYNNDRNIHLSLLNYYRSVIPKEDMEITYHLESLLDFWKDGNLFLVAVRYYRKFSKNELQFHERFFDVLMKTENAQQRSFLLIFVEEWGRTETYRPLCRLIDLKLWDFRAIEATKSFIQLVAKFLLKIVEKSNDIYSLQALNLANVYLDLPVDLAEVDYLIKYEEGRRRDLRSLIRLNVATLPYQTTMNPGRFFRIHASARGIFATLEKRFGEIYKRKERKTDHSVVSNFSDVSQYDIVTSTTRRLAAEILEEAVPEY